MCDRLLKAFCACVVIVLLTGCLGFPATDQPSSDHSLYLENHGNESATFDITVVRNATNVIVHNRSYMLGSGEQREVYNTDQAPSNGIETFEFRWAVRNETGQEDIMTNRCYGSVYVIIKEDGTATATHSIC